jgi:hypothetical protein
LFCCHGVQCVQMLLNTAWSTSPVFLSFLPFLLITLGLLHLFTPRPLLYMAASDVVSPLNFSLRIYTLD